MAFRSTTDAIGKLGAVNDTGVAQANVAGEQSYRTVMWGIWLMMAAALATAALVVGSVQRVSSLIGEIASAIEEQSQRVGEVNTAISQLYGMAQLTPRWWSSPPRRWRAFGSRARDQRSGQGWLMR